MSPQHQQQPEYPTSPWTEAFQAVPAAQPERQHDMAPQSQQTDDAETQEPTRHALSDIYNRGY